MPAENTCARVSASATAEATLCAPSITSHGFWPATSTRAGHCSAAKPLHDVTARDRKVGLGLREQIEAGQHHGDVVSLVRAQQRQRQLPPVARTRFAPPHARQSVSRAAAAGGMSSYQKSEWIFAQPAAALPGDAANGYPRLGVARPADAPAGRA